MHCFTLPFAVLGGAEGRGAVGGRDERGAVGGAEGRSGRGIEGGDF